jgi:DNA-binding CsgD family transcriptional regulator
VGRDPELDALARWLTGPRPALLEIDGEAGIGKTTLWEEAMRLARDAGCLVLSCRPAEVETAVSYGALSSLLEAALELVDGDVPPPRLRALEGALRLRDVPISSLDETAVALGALSVLRAAAAHRHVVVAIDDVQWLDASSRAVLTYALRNLRRGDDVSVSIATREGAGGGPLQLAGSELDLAVERLRPGPLSVGALHRVVHRRLGAPLSRPKLVRLHSVSGGNPLHAIELARVVAAAGPHDKVLDVPASLADVLRARIEPLSARTRRLLVAVAAAGDVRPELLARLATASEIDEAVDHGVLVLVDGHVRFSHPLLASTVYGDAGELLRARVHLRLAQLADSSEVRAQHLALAGTGPHEQIAAELEGAAETACRRGAHAAGAGLYERAASLTPPAHESTQARRLVAAAEAHFRAGEVVGARSLLEALAAREGPGRSEALLGLGWLLDETVGGDASLAPFEQALATDDPAIASQAHRGLAQSLSYVGSLDQALEQADAAVAAAEPLADRRVLAYALSMQALVRKLAGHPGWRAPLERGLALESTVDLTELDGCPSAVAADTLRLVLELDEARGSYETMLERAVEHGDVRTEAWCRYGLAAVEIASGRPVEAAESTEELLDLAEQTGFLRLPAIRTAAHVALLRGDVGKARSLLGTVIAEAEPSGELHNLRAALQLEGHLELSVGDPRAALAPLGRARAIAEQMAVGEPSILLFLLDEVEALAGTGDRASAAQVLQSFEERTEGNVSRWTAPLVARARGLLQAAEGDVDAARATFEAAVAEEHAVPLPLERARTRLALGRVLRRLQQRSAAHAMLTAALVQFEEVGAALWAERAREELGRIGGRAPSNDELTPTERRIAELVAEGLTNREVAAALFVTPKTVESTLTRVYRKLGVRSRTGLARHLAEHA